MNAHSVAVALAGPSGSGKSTLAVTLAAALRHEGVRVTLLHQDSYFRLPKPASYWSTPPEHDTPAAVDMERLAEDVRAAGLRHVHDCVAGASPARRPRRV